ncbi:MAG TPA: M56 family metallopeptidase [Gemmatimonadaceae bacterium]|jgi:beta-lactamase regulating signal transducer with metallopeptidase domain
MSLTDISVALLTYATHSAVACLAAFAGVRLLRNPRDRDVLWKTTFIAPVLTTTAALVVGNATPAWPAIDLSGVVRQLWSRPLPERNVVVLVHKLATDTSVQRTVNDPVDRALSIATIVIVALCVTIALLRLVQRYRALSAHVANRTIVAIDSDVRISISDDLPTPVALGSAEICLPSFVAHDFDQAQRSALLAHESAHLARRDPIWFAVIDVVGALSAFQPLCRRATRAFRHNAELICDEAALRTTHDRRALIGALAALAAPYDDLAVPAARATTDDRPLVARAERIARVDIASDSHARVLTLAIAVGAAIALVALPTIRPAPRDPEVLSHLPGIAEELPPSSGHLVVQRKMIRVHDRRIIRQQ